MKTLKTKKQEINELSDLLDSFPDVITSIEENERYQMLVEQEIELSREILIDELTLAAINNAKAGKNTTISPESFSLNIFKNRSKKVQLNFADISKIEHSESSIEKIKQ
jgi:hypothetical protein